MSRFAPADLGELRSAVYVGSRQKHFSEDYLKALTPLSLAIWYMDDGGFAVRSKGVQHHGTTQTEPWPDSERAAI